MALNENAKKWVAALRSEEFKQGTGYLHPDKDTWCCLGVACELYRREKVGEWDEQHAFLSIQHILPIPVMQWLGLSDPNGSYTLPFNESSALDSDNDNACTFEDIAAIIESEQKGLFT